jgi:ubiquinone/menaquinone biosynthesis C-methylase UbiE
LINILSAIYAEPHCIILDEPTSKLDLINNVKVAQLLVQAAERDIIIIATTHDAKLANRIANRIFNLEHGKIVGHPNKISNSKEYRSAPRINYAKRFTELPEEFKCDDDDWWKYKPGGLFTEAYFDGDNSYQGYLAGEDLPRNSRTCREVDGCLHILRPPKRAVIVDVPCGWGRHSIEFARNGYKVIGVDLSPDYLTKARAKATEVASDLDIDFLQSDMRELRLPNGCADFIVNLWTSFGFFKNKEDDLRTLAEFSRILRPGGKVLIHNDLNPQMVQQGIFEEPVTRELIGGGTLRVQEYFCQEDNRVYGIWEVEASSDVKTCHQYAINVYQTEDFVNMAKKVGLEECGVYGGFSANPVSPTERDQEFIIILRKPSLDGRN